LATPPFERASGSPCRDRRRVHINVRRSASNAPGTKKELPRGGRRAAFLKVLVELERRLGVPRVKAERRASGRDIVRVRVGGGRVRVRERERAGTLSKRRGPY